jgi:hypothetical protein
MNMREKNHNDISSSEIVTSQCPVQGMPLFRLFYYWPTIYCIKGVLDTNLKFICLFFNEITRF